MTRAAIPTEVFTSLARTRPAPAGTRALRAALHARRMLLVKSLLVRVDQQSRLLSPVVRRRFEKDWELLLRAERTNSAAAHDVLDYPMVGAWLAETIAAPAGTAFDTHLAHLGGVAAAAAVRAGCAVDDVLPVPSGALYLPGLGVLHCPSGRARLSDDTGSPRIRDGAGHSEAVLPRTGDHPDTGRPPRPGESPGWAPLHTLPGSAVVLDDLDPYRAPPHGIGPRALRAAERPHHLHPGWAGRWREACALLSVADPGRVVETRAVLRAVVPLASRARGEAAPMGATLRAAPGAALTQLPADAMELAACLVHETHHTKLAALDEFVPLCRPGGDTRHRVAWRTDPRPVPAVLQGAYAHLAVTDLWWRVRTGPASPHTWPRRAGERLEEYRADVGEALSVLLESDELTCAGREFVQQMASHHASLGMAPQYAS